MKISRANSICRSSRRKEALTSSSGKGMSLLTSAATKFIDKGTSALPRRSVAKAGFTMIEIALCLAIIGFALVAIIGVLPAGLNVQRNNREETIISQDATYLMDAIRSGARGLDDLTNYVYTITNVVTGFDADGRILPNYPVTYGYSNSDYTINNVRQPQAAIDTHAITNGYRIIGLLSTPKYTPTPASERFSPAYDDFGHRIGFGPFLSNYVTAYVRSISGNATEKPPQNDPRVREIGFSYKLISEVTPYSSYDTNWINFADSAIAGNTNEIAARLNAWLVAKHIHTNLYDLRLRFLWPLLPNGSFGNGRQSYRTMAGGYLTNNPPFYHIESRAYASDYRLPVNDRP